MFKQAHIFLLKGYVMFRCILQLVFNRTEMENLLYQELSCRALANGQTLFDKYRPEAASLLTLTSSSNPSPSWNIFTGSSVNSQFYSGTGCVVKMSHGTISVSLRAFSTKTLEEMQGKKMSGLWESMQPFSAVWEHLPPLFNNQRQSDLVPPVTRIWSSIAIWTKTCKT